MAPLKLSELKKKARAQGGVAYEDVDGVDDEDDPKAAAIELLVKAADVAWAEEEKAEVIAAKAARAAAEAEEQVAASAKTAETAATALKVAKEHAFRAELAPLKLSELKKKARAEGFSEDAIDGADDEDDPKAAITNLLVKTAAEWDFDADFAAVQDGPSVQEDPSAAGAEPEPAAVDEPGPEA